jgi:hypothetical protein
MDDKYIPQHKRLAMGKTLTSELPVMKTAQRLRGGGAVKKTGLKKAMRGGGAVNKRGIKRFKGGGAVKKTGIKK